MLFDKDSKLSDIVLRDASVIQVLNRFGIYLGVGDSTVEECCAELGINTQFLLTIVNTRLNEDYFPERELMCFSVEEIEGYLAKAESFCREFLLPNVERHFNSLSRATPGGNSNIDLLLRFFLEFKQELLASIKDGCGQSCNTDSAIDKLDDLVSFFVVHLRGEYDPNLCIAVVTALFTLEKELKQSRRIRKRILQPLLSDRTGDSQDD